jgi:hypothetical protein
MMTRVNLWRGQSVGEGGVKVGHLSEFPDPWAAVRWACNFGGPGVYALAGLPHDFTFEVIDAGCLRLSDMDVGIRAALDEALATERQRAAEVA